MRVLPLDVQGAGISTLTDLTGNLRQQDSEKTQSEGVLADSGGGGSHDAIDSAATR